MAIGVAHPCIESWLLADAAAIRRALALPATPKLPAEPEKPWTVEQTSIIGSPIVLPEKPDPDEAALLLGLDSGKVTRLRLVFRPSRDVALAQPHFDRYWGGTLDVEVPVTRGPEGGIDARFR